MTAEEHGVLVAFGKLLNDADITEEAREAGHRLMVGLIHGLTEQCAPFVVIEQALIWAQETGAQNGL